MKKEREAIIAKKTSNSAMSNSNQSNGSHENTASEQRNAYYSKPDSGEKIKDKMKHNILGLFRRENSKASRNNGVAPQGSTKPISGVNASEIRGNDYFQNENQA
jgi:hypothetical protein